MNKKGLSTIVATVLIILLVIAAITLVWNPIRNMISKQSEEVEAGCLLANVQITGACMEGTNLMVTISNGAEKEIDGVQVIYGDDKGNLNNSIDKTTSIGLNVISTIEVTNAKGTPKSVRIAAIIGDKTCGAGDTKSVEDEC